MIVERWRSALASISTYSKKIGVPTPAVLAVTKLQNQSTIRELINAGLNEIGENRPKSLIERSTSFPNGPKLHYIGIFQRRNLPTIAKYSDYIPLSGAFE